VYDVDVTRCRATQ